MHEPIESLYKLSIASIYKYLYTNSIVIVYKIVYKGT